MSAKTNQKPQIPATELRKLGDFCATYTFIESDELLCRSVATLIGRNYDKLSNFSKERLLNFFEALEEVLPALYEIHEKLKQVQNQKEKEGIYQDLVSSKDLFASFKRHPE